MDTSGINSWGSSSSNSIYEPLENGQCYGFTSKSTTKVLEMTLLSCNDSIPLKDMWHASKL